MYIPIVSTFKHPIHNTISSIRESLENRLMVISGIVIPLLALMSYPNTDRCLILQAFLFFSAISAIIGFIVHYQIKPIHQYFFINSIWCFVGFTNLLIPNLLYVGVSILMLLVVLNTILRGEGVGYRFVFVVIGMLSNLYILENVGIIHQNDLPSTLSWVIFLSGIAVILFLMVYCIGFFYGSILTLLDELNIKNRIIQQILETDRLTGLGNRMTIDARLDSLMNTQLRKGGITFVMFMDLDGFKIVNDTYSHAAGDHVLKQVAVRLKKATRPQDVIARMGGDEFVIVIHMDTNLVTSARTQCEEMANRILASITEPILWETNLIQIGASIGVAEYLDISDTTPEQLLHQADILMFSVKKDGKNGIRFTTI